MNVVLYHTNSNKKINGTLFYCFEYFIFLKQHLPDIKYFLLNTDDEELELFKSVFNDKYLFDPLYLDDIVTVNKYTDFMRYDINNLMILDVNTYKKIRHFTHGINSIRVYSNDTHSFLDIKPNHVFYGWYDYQIFNIKTRLKLYSEIHRTFDSKGGGVFISSPEPNNRVVVDKLGLSEDRVYVKKFNEHITNLFENIDSVVYWHTDKKDTNNRVVVESFIHDIPITIYYNGYENDSIWDRYDVMTNGNPKDLFLGLDDILIRDFLHDCQNI